MPVLNAYVSGGGYYVRAARGGRISTFQLSPAGTRCLIHEHGLESGSEFGYDLLDTLFARGWAYTGGSGPGEIDPQHLDAPPVNRRPPIEPPPVRRPTPVREPVEQDAVRPSSADNAAGCLAVFVFITGGGLTMALASTVGWCLAVAVGIGTLVLSVVLAGQGGTKPQVPVIPRPLSSNPSGPAPNEPPRPAEAPEPEPDPRPHWPVVVAGYRLGKTGDRHGAMVLYRQALAMNAYSDAAMNCIAWGLATDPDATPAGIDEAIELAHRACGQTDYAHANYVDTLSVAYERAGDLRQATWYAKRAVRAANGLERDRYRARLTVLRRRR